MELQYHPPFRLYLITLYVITYHVLMAPVVESDFFPSPPLIIFLKNGFTTINDHLDLGTKLILSATSYKKKVVQINTTGEYRWTFFLPR